MAMAELPPPSHIAPPSPSLGMHQHWPPAPDQRDAYISWLRSEFAAANAIIDNMCHHLRSIGAPGEYDLFFTCLQRRRHSWTPSLYMQQFFSVSEIVDSLQQVSWKRQDASLAPPKTQHLAEPPRLQPGRSTESCLSEAETAPQQSKSEETVPAKHRTAEEGNVVPDYNSSDESGSSSSSSSFAADNFTEANGDSVENPKTDGDEVSQAHSAMQLREINRPNGRLIDKEAAADCAADQELSEDRKEDPSKNSEDAATEDATSKGKMLLRDMTIAVEGEDERRALIKRSMQFQCCEREDGQLINNGESAELCENVLSTTEIENLVELVSQLQEAGIRGELGGSFCRSSDHVPDVLQFGNKHRHTGQKNDIRPFPKFMQSIINWLTRCGILPGNKRPDLCVVSIFEEGDFEAPNTDQCAWEKPLCILSLMGECTMIFGHSIASDQKGSCKGPFQVELPAGSALLLQENFTGILQKAVPASSNRRMTIALGKASSSLGNKGGRNNKWAGVASHHHNLYNANKQAVIAQIAGMAAPMHPSTWMPHLLQPNSLPAFPSSPNGLLNPYMTQHPGINPGWSGLPGVVPRAHNPGTGVFFPSSEPPHGASSWQSGVIVVSSFSSQKNGSMLEVRRASQSKKGDKHSNQFSGNHQAARIKVSVDLIATKKKPSKNTTAAAAAPCQEIVVEGAENGGGRPQQSRATTVEG